MKNKILVFSVLFFLGGVFGIEVQADSDSKPTSFLYAPFQTTGEDIYCRFPKVNNKCQAGDSLGGVCYKEWPTQGKRACEAQGGVLVQKVESDSNNPLGVVEKYIAKIVLLSISLGVGVSVLILVLSGVQIIFSGEDADLKGKAKEMFSKGIGGLVVLILAATILHTINPLFFTL
jgi:hypothetical protein